MNVERARPEDFLELVERAKRGRLKVYIGPAAGVGKTYQMLEEAHVLKKRGVEVVLAFIETHGRAETAALIEGLEVIPRRQFEYRGVMVEEMDLDAVLARRPQVAIVDELAHTNVPGSRNKKRYQDVLELLEAGINVICAFNVQHLESLNDLVKQATDVVVRETIPDSFLKQADQIVNLDLAAEDLLERLRAGKIYSAEKIPWALEHFFKAENLSTLREIALREVAENINRSASAQISTDKAAHKAASERVMVCLSSYPPHGATLLRRGSRMAGRLNTDWYAVYVETPNETPTRIDAEAQRHLLDNIEKARQLGAEVIRLQAKDPVPALIEFARSHGVGHILIGRSPQPWWRQLLSQSIMLRLVKEAADLDVHIVSFESAERQT
ncbi:MAG TPA: histidine kinase [Candidatus Binatia bacterium]|nr:histidine kinase [Candidatus Binatia bacterium]